VFNFSGVQKAIHCHNVGMSYLHSKIHPFLLRRLVFFLVFSPLSGALKVSKAQIKELMESNLLSLPLTITSNQMQGSLS
jgi:hypothetical protein